MEQLTSNPRPRSVSTHTVNARRNLSHLWIKSMTNLQNIEHFIYIRPFQTSMILFVSSTVTQYSIFTVVLKFTTSLTFFCVCVSAQ